MLEQYFELRSRYPEAVLLMRVGDFYEAYGDDAETIARALSIALTSKEAGSGQRVAMAGVPHHALDAYLAKLVKARYVVALGEQMEAPIPNKLTRRDVVRVVTPGTLIEEQLLERSANNYLLAISGVGDTFGGGARRRLDRLPRGDRVLGRRRPGTKRSPRSGAWRRPRSSPTCRPTCASRSPRRSKTTARGSPRRCSRSSPPRSASRSAAFRSTSRSS